MKMKPLFGLIAGAILILSSCATTNEVNGGGIFQKRKYNKGFYWNKGGSSSESAVKINAENLETEEMAISTAASPNEKPSSTKVNNGSYNDQTVATATVKSEDKTLKNEGFFTKGMTENALVKAVHPIKKMAQMESKMIHKTVAKAKAPGREGDLGYILGIVLIVLLIIIIFSLLRELLYDIFPFLGPLLALILLIVLIVLLLRWLGIM